MRDHVNGQCAAPDPSCPEYSDTDSQTLSHIEQALARPLLILDHGLHVLRISPEFCALLPQGGPFVGQPLAQIIDHSAVSMLGELVDRALLCRQSVQECIINDQQILRGQVTPFYQPNGALQQMIILLEDETTTQRAVLEAEQSHHIQSAFLARMSHELRTPLNAIIGYTDIILHQNNSMLSDPVRQQEYLNAVWESGRYMLDLVENLLDVSRMASGPVQLRQSDVPLCQTMRSVMDELAPQAVQGQITLDVECPQPLPTMRGDSEALRRIVHNLLGNAIKYTPAGGRVKISVNHSTQGLELHIRDTGIGIHPDDLERIFNPFERGRIGMKHTREGAGLGLSIAKSLILLQDGWIDVHSTLGQGTMVTVGFPHHRLRTAAHPKD